MKTLALLSLCLVVALGLPPYDQGVVQNPALTDGDQNPLPGDQEKLAPVAMDTEHSESIVELKAEPEVKPGPDVKAEPGVKVEPQVMAEVEVNVKPEVEMEPELKDDSDFKVESEVKVEPDALEEQMNLKPETKTDQEVEERHINMEEKHGMMAEPVMELEPLDAAAAAAAAIVEEGPALDIMGQQMPPLEDYFPNEEARMGMQLDSFTGEGSVNMMMEESATTRQSSCPGVLLEGKCYQFFKGPKRASDAEFFCQQRFLGGHLASITSQHIHRELMRMILQQNGAYTRTWIGGLRYLDTGRFVWLDGSYWSYDDWLAGEPNDTSHVEDCVEVLAFGNGKFNDFTCWEPQAFICSYAY